MLTKTKVADKMGRHLKKLKKFRHPTESHAFLYQDIIKYYLVLIIWSSDELHDITYHTMLLCI